MEWVWALGSAWTAGQERVRSTQLDSTRLKSTRVELSRLSLATGRREGGKGTCTACGCGWGRGHAGSQVRRVPLFSWHVVSSCFVLRRLNSVRSHASARHHGRRFRIRCAPRISRSNVIRDVYVPRARGLDLGPRRQTSLTTISTNLLPSMVPWNLVSASGVRRRYESAVECQRIYSLSPVFFLLQSK